jgi:hypothetical protein
MKETTPSRPQPEDCCTFYGIHVRMLMNSYIHQQVHNYMVIFYNSDIIATDAEMQQSENNVNKKTLMMEWKEES